MPIDLDDCEDVGLYPTPSHDSIHGRGGWHEVDTIIDRDAIPDNLRRVGMVASVTRDPSESNNIPWVLTQALNWVPLQSDSSAVIAAAKAEAITAGREAGITAGTTAGQQAGQTAGTTAGNLAGATSGSEAAAALIAPILPTIIRNTSKIAYPAEIIAHRFFARVNPQNTIYAAKWAVAHGFTSLETDLRVTADKQIIHMHDANLISYAQFGGEVASLPYAQIAQADVSYYWDTNSQYYSPLRAPLLTEFLAAMQGQVTRFYAEIKGYTTQSDIALMLAPIVAAGWEDITWIASFNMNDLRYIRQTLGNKRIGLSYTASTLTETTVLEAIALGNMDFSLDKNFLLANPGYVEFIRAHGSDVKAWTLLNPSEAAALQAIGVRRLIADAPYVVSI